MATPTKKPEVKRGSGTDQLPYGAATKLNKAASGATGAAGGTAPASGGVGQSTPAYQEITEPQKPTELKGDLTGFDDLIFGSSDRPGEPITAGAPFGAGPTFTRYGGETDRQFMTRVANDVANSPTANRRTKAFAARVMRGQ